MKMTDGSSAKLVGRFNLPNSKRLLIYTVDINRACSPLSNTETTCLVPTAVHRSNLNDQVFVKYSNSGIKNLVFHQDVWEAAKAADEIEIYSNITKQFYNNETQLKQSEEQSTLEQNHKEESNKIMTEKKSNSTMNMLTQAGLDAAKQVGAGKANEVLTEALKKGLKAAGVPDQYVESQLGLVAMQLLGPAGIHYLAETQAETIDNMIGNGSAERIKEVCKFATQSVAVDYMQPLMAFAIPVLKELASNGMQTMTQEDSTVEMFDTQKEKVTV